MCHKLEMNELNNIIDLVQNARKKHELLYFLFEAIFFQDS